MVANGCVPRIVFAVVFEDILVNPRRNIVHCTLCTVERWYSFYNISFNRGCRVLNGISNGKVVCAWRNNHIGSVLCHIWSGSIERKVSRCQRNGIRSTTDRRLSYKRTVAEIVHTCNSFIGLNSNLCQKNVWSKFGVHTTWNKAKVAGLVIKRKGVATVSLCGCCCTAIAWHAKMTEVIGRSLRLCRRNRHRISTGSVFACVVNLMVGLRKATRIQIESSTHLACRVHESSRCALAKCTSIVLHKNFIGSTPCYICCAAQRVSSCCTRCKVFITIALRTCETCLCLLLYKHIGLLLSRIIVRTSCHYQRCTCTCSKRHQVFNG